MNIHPPISLNGKSAGNFLKKHYRLLLSLVFIIAIGLWGYIFWQYVYQVALYDPHPVVKPLPIKQKELNVIINDLQSREKLQGIINEKTFPEPFIEPPKDL